MSNVTLDNGNIKIDVLLGDATPILSDGVTTWDTVARPKRTGLTRFTGRNPFKQDITVMFDGWQNIVSQEARIHKLVTMGSQPHTITLGGQALRKDLDWVITDITWDDQNTIWHVISGRTVRIRQSAVIHLLEYVKDSVIKTPAKAKIADDKPVKRVSLPKGMTLKAVAVAMYGDPDRWMDIKNANMILIGADPRTWIMAGTMLIIPHKSGLNTFYTVP